MRNTYLQQCDLSSCFRTLKGDKISLVASALIASVTFLQAAPIGGVVTSGTASIVSSGSVTNITQTTQKAAINWQDFSIGTTETVNFNQPNISSVTLNRVVGNEKSVIDGALNANGQVFILNSNGVLFSKNASINTAGLVATTMNLSDTDFMNGNYAFKGDSAASIINQGTITISDKGYAALFGKELINEGIIKATLGKINLTGASEVTLNLNGNSLVNLMVNKGVLDALVENKGAIYADGGEVYLTTNAVNELLRGVVNNTGIAEAQTLDDITGKIIFFAHGGEAKIGGSIIAEGGFVETSGKEFSIAEGAIVKAGEWLIDPVNVTIDNALATSIVTALGTGSVTITTAGGNTPDTASGESGTEGNINVNSEIAWATNNRLTLSAYNNITVNENITHTGTSAGGVIFLYGQGTANGGTSTYSVASGKTVTSPSLQWRKGSDLASARYAIVDGSVFLGGKYIEVGISATAGGKFGTTNKPSLFFGRQGGNSGVGMTGDADGFGTGADLRIDYFLPGTPYEEFAAGYTIAGVQTTGSNFATVLGNITLLGLDSDNKLKANVVSTLGGKLQVSQQISFGLNDKFFNNSVTLENIGASALNSVVFVRGFDPDNTVDMDGALGWTPQILINSTMAAGDTATVISATSNAADAYATASGGSQSKIIYYTADASASVGFNIGRNVPYTMLTGATAKQKGDSTTSDTGVAIAFNVGDLSVGASKSLSYLTSLDNRDISTILGELQAASGGSTPTPPTQDLTQIVTQITNNTAVQPPVFPTFTPPALILPTPLQQFSFGGQVVQLMSTPSSDIPTDIVTMADIRQMQPTNSDSSSQGNAGSVGNTDIRVPLGQNSLIQLLNGGVNLPTGIEQEFFMARN